MRIGTITNWAYGLTLLFTAVSGAAFLAAEQADRQERQAIERQMKLDQTGQALELAVELRSDAARLYVVRGDPRHLAAFERDTRDVRSRERALDRAKAHELTPAERDAVTEAERNADALDALERSAIAQARAGRRDTAREMLYGDAHERLQNAVLQPVARFQALVDERARGDVAVAQARHDWLSWLAKLLLGCTAALFLAVLYFVLRRRVALPLAQMTGIVTRLAQQDFSVEVPQDPRRDEIGDMHQAIQVFRRNGIERDRLEALARADQQAKDLILQLMHRAQAAQTEDELADVVARFAPRIFTNLAGSLYVLDGDRTQLNLAAS